VQPTYFTVGNLVQFLQKLEEKGMTRRDHRPLRVLHCRRLRSLPVRHVRVRVPLALRNSGFDGFRVLLFQQSGGLSQSDVEAGLEMNLDFFLGILNALNCGDILNEVAYAIRPFEAKAGETDETLGRVMDHMHDVFKNRKPLEASYAGKFMHQLRSDDYTSSLRMCRDMYND
jgi:hypothetical protein